MKNNAHMMPESSSSPHSFVTTITAEQGKKLLAELKRREYAITTPPHTHFSAKDKGLSCTLFQSGKLVVQGKKSAEFIEFYLEPEILNTFDLIHPKAGIEFHPHIGIDESGKGDFFGPLCVAGVYVTAEDAVHLQKIGVKDSKKLSDEAIRKIGNQIKKRCHYQIVKINPKKYNEIYKQFKNLNRLLAWGHATTIEQLVINTGCTDVIIDQFADERVVETALKRKKLLLNLTQRHRAEEDLVVAAASILARQAFIDGLEALGRNIEISLPKGGGNETIKIGKQILKEYGLPTLLDLCKEHFKNLKAILD